ncbi:MAG: hypothetical protein HOP12_13835 [Candidatus Eisenbacteria bacterium]|uniref:4-diphosphocytidyl-2-C-methyl-D-erythritol kinase n=1 Tax=Eiseniibacteriota bacterium TaxID=2212470 RepID=A0A849SIM7_UNCEI|nr:hypothetical protein [Candidatus Eisenbacteria bacterium]
MTVFQSVSLADTLIVRPRARGFRLRVRYEDAAVARPSRSRKVASDRASSPKLAKRAGRSSRVPAGADNLVLRAARLAARTLGVVRGADFELIKRIPVQAGMGGGSADAAAAVIGIARLNGLRLGAVQKLALATALGSDVPFAIRGGTAIGRGRGELLAPVRLDRRFRAVVAMPAWGISTRAAFARIDRAKYGLTRWRATLRFAKNLDRNIVSIDDALRFGNSFERVLGDRGRDFVSLCGRLEASGARHPRMTGSGSAVFAVLPPDVAARHVLAHFVGPERLFFVRSVPGGMLVTRI